MDLLVIRNDEETVARRDETIRSQMLSNSPNVRHGNFTAIAPEDLQRLLALYDSHYFGGWLEREVQAQSHRPLGLKLSKLMTRAGGKTTRLRRRRHGKTLTIYEIAVAARMLLMSFRDERREVVVCGRRCQDRLAALQRILEHEIIHLCELLAWGKSTCAGKRFKALAAAIFGHDGTKHDLVTPREQAAVQHGLKVGSPVRFTHAGRTYTGRINRIHRRATVLVEDPAGQAYSDGKRYSGFYVPLPALTLVATP